MLFLKFIILIIPVLNTLNTHGNLLLFPVVLFFFLKYKHESSPVFFKDLRFLILIFLIGCCSTLWNWDQEDPYILLRGVFYFTIPIMMICLGCALYHSSGNAISLIGFVFGVNIAYAVVLILIRFYYTGSFIVDEISERGIGSFTNEIALPLIVLMTMLSNKIYLWKKKWLYLLCFINISIVLVSFSRTNILIFVITTLLISFHSIKMNKMVAYALIFVATANILFGPSIYRQLGEPEEIGYEHFASKIKNSFSEFLIAERYQQSNINNEWRGHEANIGLQDVYRHGAFAILWGLGFQAVTINDIFWETSLSNLPIFHIGYVTIIQKTGFIGLCLFFLFIITLLKSRTVREQSGLSQEQCFLQELKTLLVVYILIYTQLTHGIFTSYPPFFCLVLLGIIIAEERDPRAEIPVNCTKSFSGRTQM